jgi:hypothetical protein
MTTKPIFYIIIVQILLLTGALVVVDFSGINSLIIAFEGALFVALPLLAVEIKKVMKNNLTVSHKTIK